MSGERDWRGRRLHFVGIAGSGMSGLASLCASLGAAVSGSDRVAGETLERLQRHGITAIAGHAAENVPADAELVYTSAVAQRELGTQRVVRGRNGRVGWHLPGPVTRDRRGHERRP